MVDTIILTLRSDMYRITEPDMFTPSARWALHGNCGIHGMQSKQNPTAKELRNGIYKPRLTLLHRVNVSGNSEVILRIELSLPKLLFRNNFDELQYKDFSELVQKLVHILEQMGIATTEKMVAHAPVSAIHYAKNMPLTDGSIPYYFINKIKEANISLALDVNQTDYRNEGHSYKWHANSYEVVFYDKIRDLEKARKSSKRAIEKDSLLQLWLFDSLQQRKKFELLRMEVRLNKRQKIKHLFSTLNIDVDLVFKRLFKPAIAKKVLLYYLDEVMRKRPTLLDYKATSSKSLLATLLYNNPTLKPKQIFQLYGLKHALDVANIRELRVMFSHCNARSWNRLITDLQKAIVPQTHNHFEAIRNQLLTFKTTRMAQCSSKKSRKASAL